MTLAAKNWKEWVHMFFHGRTHVAYGSIASALTSLIGAIVAPTIDLRALFAISSIGSVGVLVDTTAHLYYH